MKIIIIFLKERNLNLIYFFIFLKEIVMSLLSLIKNHIKNGSFREARRLIDNEDDVLSLMGEAEPSNHSQISHHTNQHQDDNIPLLVMLSLVKNEDTAVILSRILLEKGYYLDVKDKNGLCALNYAIALNRIKLLNLFLSSFNFELDSYRDCYKNSFLHYVFAVNNKQVVNKFSEIYSKYYEWDVNKFKFIKNKDGLSVKDVYDYKITKNLLKVKSVTSGRNYRIMSSYRPYRNEDASKSTQLLCMPKSFYLESNPIHICKFINQVFANFEKTNLNADLKFVENNIKNLSFGIEDQYFKINSSTTREFKMNILNQIKSINKSLQHSNRNTSQSASPNKFQTVPFYSEDMPQKYLYNKDIYGLTARFETHSNLPSLISNKQEYNWKTDIGKVFLDYSVATTPSFRLGSVPAYKLTNSENNFENSLENFDYDQETNNNNNTNNNNSKSKSATSTQRNSMVLLQNVSNQANNSNGENGNAIHSTLHNLNQSIEIKQKNSSPTKGFPKLN